MKHNKSILATQKLWLFLGIFGLLSFPNLSSAQCTYLAFNDNLEISVGSTCEALINKDVVLENDGNCPDDVTITLIEVGGSLIASGLNEVLLPAGYAGTSILIHVSHSSGLSGSTTADITDTSSPVIVQCDTEVISCTASLDPAQLAPVVIEDNCDPNLYITYFDAPAMGPECTNGNYIYSIARTYNATDASGNTASCVQSIFVDRPDLSDVTFPVDVTLNCGQSTDPAITGFPLLDGQPISNNGFCHFVVQMQETIADVCLPGGFEIIRTWSVFNWCTNTTVTGTQIIAVEDTTPPVITCPDNIVVGTDPGLCTATITLPAATATDDCSSVSFSVNTNYGQIDFGPYSNVPKGNYLASYTATDGCTNASDCLITVTVVDLEEPTPICDEITNVSLSSNGMSVVNASVFDDGSLDNCSPVFFEVSRDGDPFGASVVFDCNDLGAYVTITMKVAEVFNPASSITCMIQVDVEDAVPPMITCPIDLTVDCDNDFSDLSVFGAPTIYDACGFTSSESADFDLTTCGTGTITRTFSALDGSNNSTGCDQVITVNNQTPFDGSSIVFPANYTTNEECILPDMLDPDDLPSGLINYSTPTYGTEACAMIATSYTDQLFQIEFPACYKIVRTWSVIDWCTHDAFNPTAGGLWTAQQVIKVNDTIPPVLMGCPTDTVIAVGPDCLFGAFDIDPVSATDCSPSIEYSNNSAYATVNGADISGSYPLGSTTVVISADDGCGNTTVCSTTITVEDQTVPNAICNDGIVAELQDMTGGIMAMVPLMLIESGSYDNCTPENSLTFGMRLVGDPDDPTATSLTFDCDDIGLNDIEIWVTDLDDNAGFCQTFVEIQDNMNLCPPPLVAGMIEGHIDTEMGSEVEEVEVTISSGSNALPDMTGLSGSFAVPDLPLGQSYTVIPAKDVNPDNGVTTFDMVKLSKHILGTEILDTPYKMIAADVNNSGSLTTLDLVHMRKMILHIYDEFPANTSWRFVDKDYEFPDPTNPFTEDFPEVITIDDLTQSGAETDFWAIKTGDLNYSAVTNNLLASDDRNFEEYLLFELENQTFEKGDLVTIDFSSANFEEVIGYQFSLEFDTETLVFENLELGGLEKLKENNFGFTLLEEGVITSSWYTAEAPVRMERKSTLFSLSFRAMEAGTLSEFLHLNSRATLAEAYAVNHPLMGVQLQFEEEQAQASFELFQNKPNPFKESTEIEFFLPNSAAVQLEIVNLSGQLIQRLEGDFGQGYHSIIVNKEDLDATGVFYYRLQVGAEQAVRKMVVLR